MHFFIDYKILCSAASTCTSWEGLDKSRQSYVCVASPLIAASPLSTGGTAVHSLASDADQAVMFPTNSELQSCCKKWRGSKLWKSCSLQALRKNRTYLTKFSSNQAEFSSAAVSYVLSFDIWLNILLFSLIMKSEIWRMCSCEYMLPSPPYYQQISLHSSTESSSPCCWFF